MKQKQKNTLNCYLKIENIKKGILINISNKWPL